MVSRVNFSSEFLKNRGSNFFNFIESVNLNGNKIFSNNQLQNNTCDVILINMIHPFFNCTLNNNKFYNKKTIPHYGAMGVGIMLDKPYSFESYFNEFTKRQLRKNLRSDIKHLEEDCQIVYEYNYGKITEEKFNFLINTHKKFIEKRFNEKNMENYFLNNWDDNIKNLFSLINQKKASLFVIYDDKKPIGISINSHVNDTVFYSESHSYDIDYGKYSLGHIDNKIIIEWCINNNYKFIDLGIGAFDYKKKWCNTTYNLEYHIYYKKNSLKASILAYVEVVKIYVKNLSKKVIDTVLRRKP